MLLSKSKIILLGIITVFSLSSCSLLSLGEKKSETIVFKNNVYKTVISPYTKRIWLDRNIGAQQLCTSATDEKCMGDYYQWGSINADTFIAVPFTSDWDESDPNGIRRMAFLNKTDGSGMCPVGFRVPSQREFLDEAFEISKDLSAYDFFMKIPFSGYRFSSGDLLRKGKLAYFWTSTAKESTSSRVGMHANGQPYTGGASGNMRGEAYNIRCIKSNN